MLFPESPRVSYARNPLEQVICQLRFPALLRIVAEPPVKFQEAIRQQFPILKERQQIAIEVPGELRKVIPAELLASPADRAFDFASEDDSCTVSLAKGFLALSTSRYSQWEKFREKLRHVWTAFQSEYHPTHLIRVGLRYRNAISRKLLGLDGTPWRDLLKEHILGVLQEPSIVDKVKSSIQEVLLTAGSDEQVRLRHGLWPGDPAEVPYVIDADFFTEEKVTCERAFDFLDRFNGDAGRLFRWCIEERLHTALQPQILAR